MSAAAASTVVVPLVTAAVTALATSRPRLQRATSMLGAVLFLAVAIAALLASSGTGAMLRGFGGWPLPFGIAFALDGLGALLTVVAAVMGLACLLFLESDADAPSRRGSIRPLVHGLLAGVAGAFATADLFNLYVWFEVMLVCALGLLAAGGGVRHLDATFRYLVLNLIGTLLLLAAVGAIYAATGHLNFTALHAAQATLAPGLRDALLVTLLLALLMKAGAFPLSAWLPASYPTLPAAVLMLFAALLTKVGAYAVLRILGGVFAPAAGWILEALGWVACATMLTGVIGAAYHWDLRRIFSFHIISQIGYILLAIALGSTAGDSAAIFYTVHHIVVKGNLFLVSGLILAIGGSYDLRRLGGLQRSHPWLAVAFAIPALSLVGIPPLSGFWAKFLVLQEALRQGRVAWAVVGVLVSLLTMYSMIKVWQEAFWRPRAQEAWAPEPHPRLRPAWAAVFGLCAITLAISIDPQPLLAHARASAQALSMGGVGAAALRP